MQEYREILIDTELAEAQRLLASVGLGMPAGCDYGLGYYEDGVMVACGFLAGAVLCGFCVAPQAQGGGVSTAILSRLVLHGKERGLGHFFIFTKASEAEKFAAAGFTLVASSGQAALLEQGQPDYAHWLAATRSQVAAFAAAGSGAGAAPDATPGANARYGQTAPNLGAIVMNANPFTRGHEYLARTAAAACHRLLVFVVEEDVSVVPFDVRFNLVREGLAHLPNVLVLPSGPYMVSRASFPAYFTADATRGSVHAGLDCAIFATRIAPDLGISIRFVGTEPYDPVTRQYNAVMTQQFARSGLTLREVPRLESAGAAVSASRVRALLHGWASEDDWRELQTLLPPATYNFLRSGQGVELRRRLTSHEGRH
ncbi:[citrate (pro-3S)-lyase] ligase [Desulfovibrio desulfuricans]|uniref:[citrate (Pro-3S)-lyase] ligase n=1 Tax=Desulfovibrio desulfuricans TaxID=876 RepID=A0A4P7UPA4_DESDE|nr:[citrate (pro-3S)-lyase] ligase [Desulfovibrio desulfuricans]QCC86774.1 [citrate (pro-3S)-lyase] ligase [Desulfovibrio desulfuricans]